MTAPATGRTADENELREALITFIADRFWRNPGQAANHADALLSGPLAPILQEAATARKERDEAQALHRWNIDRAHGEVLVCRGLHEKGEDCDRERFVPEERLIAAEQEAATLRARLQEAEKADDFWREVLEGSSARWREAAQLAVNGDPRRLQRLLSASRSPIVGSSTHQEAGDHEQR